VSKRDDDSQADMEVGMTTAERRRRRRRGGGLRVPSDNVPRRTVPPVVPPVPEDPALAMSIAYSFTSDASEPVPRVSADSPSGRIAPTYSDPVPPDAMQTVIDPVSAPVESADFEMKTREMTAVDLQALGLSSPEPASSLTTTDPQLPAMLTRTSEIEIEVTAFEPPTNGAEGSTAKPRTSTPSAGTSKLSIPTLIPTERSSGPVSPLAPRQHPRAKTDPPLIPDLPPQRLERQKTVALSEEDLEEVREAARAATEKPMPPASASKSSQAIPIPKSVPGATKVISEEPLSVPEIDINELAERSAESSGEIEVDVTEDSGPVANAAVAARPKPASTPPPIAPAAAQTNPGVAPNGPSQTPHHPHPPPPPPAAHHHKPPPAPPPKKESVPIPVVKDPPPKPPSSRTITDTKPPMRGKPWFVDLFDEDYLRTLPFLTPQATQSEAEFVIEAMGLSPGAQVLDVGCGYGRHAMELAARGYHVVGLDLSTPLLVRGGEEAHRRGLQINFVRGDMRELDFENQFDAAYCLFSTFGYFDDETNKKTVTNIARALKPGGRVLIEILNRDYLITDLPTRVWWEGDGCVVLEEVELNYFSSRIQVNRSVVFDDGRQLEQEISVRAYSLHEVGKLMHAAGFRVLEVSGGYHTRGRFFGNQSRHIIVLAERKDTTPG
jgi:SAM-dependent methyltransferase